MLDTLPSRYKTLALAAALAFLGLGAYISNVVFAEDAVTDCCANGFDPYAEVAPEASQP